MNDEIKEILEYLKDKNDYIEDFGISYKRMHVDNGDLKILLDYISNLQQIEKEYKSKVDDIGKLTSRIYKAIEYINNNFEDDEGMICKITGEYTCEANYNFLDDLLNILQNGSDNQ